MNTDRLQAILIQNGVSAIVASDIISALKESDETSVTKVDIRDLEIRILNRISELQKEVLTGFNKVQEKLNAQTWKFLGGLTVLGFIFKLMESLK